MPDTNVDVDFGGYGVVGYEYTAWSDVFPELKALSPEVSPIQLAIGHALVWLSTRQLFGQYFRFCGKFFGDVAPEGTAEAAKAFDAAVEAISSEILNSLNKPLPELDSLPQLEARFRETLHKQKFSLEPCYDLLIDNYPWLKRVPFGAAPICMLYGQCHYQPYETRFDEAGKPVGVDAWIDSSCNQPAAVLLSKNALRLYPIISADALGRPFFFWTNVEVVNRKGREISVGATLCGCSAVCPLNPNWGMCRPHGESFAPGALVGAWKERVLRLPAGSLNSVPAIPRPSGEEIDKAIWLYNQWPNGESLSVCVARPESGSNGFLYPNQMHDGNTRFLAKVAWREETSHVGGGYGRVKPLDAAGKEVVVSPGLVPIGFDDAFNAVEPPGGFKGGGPMWFEPRTDEMVDGLNALGA